MQNITRIMVVLGVVLTCVSQVLAATGSFQGLGDLPGGDVRSSASAVSGDGSVVVGWSCSFVSGSDRPEAFRWTQKNGIVGLGALIPPGQPFFDSSATAVSADGSVVVGLARSNWTSGNPLEAFRWTEAFGMQGLGFLAGVAGSVATGVSADGSVIVGQVISAPFRWTAQTGMVDLGPFPSTFNSAYPLGVSADGNVIVGSMGISYLANTRRAFYWTEASGIINIGAPPGEPYQSTVSAASADGSVVVGERQTATNFGGEAFRWMADTGMAGLGNLPDGGFQSTYARAVSADGSVIVGYGKYGDHIKAFIWDEIAGMRLLRQEIEDACGLVLTDWTLSVPTGISADGMTIVGDGTNPNGVQEGWIARLPEPCSLGLLSLGGLAVLKRKPRVLSRHRRVRLFCEPIRW